MVYATIGLRSIQRDALRMEETASKSLIIMETTVPELSLVYYKIAVAAVTGIAFISMLI